MKYTCDTFELDPTTRPMGLVQSMKCGLYIFLIPFTTSIIVATVGLLLQRLF